MAAPSRCARWTRAFVGPLLVLLAVAGAAPAAAAPCWFPPVVGAVTDPFREPPCTWCAGNRGIEYRVATDAMVQAAASGRVVFAGAVVDVRYVVVQLANGWRHTYGQLTSSHLDVGDAVVANAAVGAASGTFFFGLRINDDYVDPAPYIGVVRRRPRLVPLDGTPARPAPPERLQCATAVTNYRPPDGARAI